MKYHLVALFTIFVWGFTFVSTKVLLVDLSPLWILLLRFVLGLCILCVMCPHVLRLKERTDEVLFAAAGATGIAAYYLLENVALIAAVHGPDLRRPRRSLLQQCPLLLRFRARNGRAHRCRCWHDGRRRYRELHRLRSFRRYACVDCSPCVGGLFHTGRSHCAERLRNDRSHEAHVRLGRCLHLGYHAHLRPTYTAAICPSRRAEPAQSALSGCSGIGGVLCHMGRCREASRGDHNDHLHLSRSRHHGDCFHSYSRRTAERAYNPRLGYDDRRPFVVSKTKHEQKDASCKTDRSVLGWCK